MVLPWVLQIWAAEWRHPRIVMKGKTYLAPAFIATSPEKTDLNQ